VFVTGRKVISKILSERRSMKRQLRKQSSAQGRQQHSLMPAEDDQSQAEAQKHSAEENARAAREIWRGRCRISNALRNSSSGFEHRRERAIA